MHDSSICIFENGKIINFLKEERFSKNKRDMYPAKSVFEIDLKNEPVDLAYSAPSREESVSNIVKTILRKNFKIDERYYWILLYKYIR